jgi:hypothetical protein
MVSLEVPSQEAIKIKLGRGRFSIFRIASIYSFLPPF